METLFYWGERGEHGPYAMDVDGWPDAGEVMRDFRVRVKKLTAKQFAVQYSNAIQTLNDIRGKKSRAEKRTEPISEEWILNMENHNRVPTDIKRRRIIATLLEIPPMLFGLAALGPTVFTLQKDHRTTTTSLTPDVVQSVVSDLTQQQKNLRLFWHLYYTDTAQDYLHEIQTAIQTLENLEAQTRGNLQQQVRKELLSNYLLASFVTRDDLIQYKVSYTCANKAVRVAKSINIPILLGSALYQRGYARLIWGLYGETDEVGVLRPDTHKIGEAMMDFEEAIPYAHPQLKGLLSLELGRIKGLLKGSVTDITIAMTMAEQAEKWIGYGQTHEIDTPILTSMGLNEGRLYLGQAVAFNAVGRFTKANEVLETLRELKDGKGIPKNHTRRNAWLDIVQAEAYMGLKEYDTVAYYAKNALAACKDIRSESNIVIITDIYSRLRNSSSKNDAEVAELGVMLRSWYYSVNVHVTGDAPARDRGRCDSSLVPEILRYTQNDRPEAVILSVAKNLSSLPGHYRSHER